MELDRILIWELLAISLMEAIHLPLTYGYASMEQGTTLALFFFTDFVFLKTKRELDADSDE